MSDDFEIVQQAPFSCFPVCAKCEREGKCDKVWHTKTMPRTRVPGTMTRAAIEAIEDRRRAPAWYMVCGHTTDYDVQLTYKVWKPKNKDSFCERCGKWQKNRPKPPPKVYPDKPPF